MMSQPKTVNLIVLKQNRKLFRLIKLTETAKSMMTTEALVEIVQM